MLWLLHINHKGVPILSKGWSVTDGGIKDTRFQIKKYYNIFSFFFVCNDNDSG